MSRYSDDAKTANPTPFDGSYRVDILALNVLTAPASPPAVDDVRWMGQPSSVDLIDYLQEENRLLKERWADAAFASPTLNADDSPEKRTRSVAER